MNRSSCCPRARELRDFICMLHPGQVHVWAHMARARRPLPKAERVADATKIGGDLYKDLFKSAFDPMTVVRTHGR